MKEENFIGPTLRGEIENNLLKNYKESLNISEEDYQKVQNYLRLNMRLTKMMQRQAQLGKHIRKIFILLD